MDFNTNINNIGPANNLSEIKYCDLLNQWLGCYYNQKGRKFWTWFNSYEEAVNYSPTI